MTIDTQKLRDLIRQSCPLPWTLATSNSWRRIVDPYHVPVCSPCNQPDGHPDLAFPGGIEGPTATLLIEAANALPELLDAMDAQAAEIARLNAIQAWQPIETAPRDGTAILLGSSDGAWIAKYDPVYPSGYRPKNPWFSLMLNHDHMGRMPNTKPTHWMPLPAAPDALQETAHDR